MDKSDPRSYLWCAMRPRGTNDDVSTDANEVAALLAVARQVLAERDAQLAERDALLTERDAALAEREAKLAAQEAELAKAASRYEALREAYYALELELKLLKRRLFIAKAERADTAQLQLEFEELTKKLDELAGMMKGGEDDSSDDGDEGSNKGRKRKPTGRRNLADMDLRTESVEITDPTMEELIAEGKAHRLPAEISYKLARKPAELYKVEIQRVTYATKPDANGLTEMCTAVMPPELLPRCMATASLLAEIATNKFNKGLPLYRQEESLRFEAVALDRGTMCRWLDQIGWSFAATVVAAMDQDAREHAFCIATDATGYFVQPGPREGGPRRPCRKGHYFVRIADHDHILFDYTKTHRTADVRVLFKGYSGYVQADACSVYNALFAPADPNDPDDDGCSRDEVGCWSHARRKFFEAAYAKEALGREGVVRIGKIFEVEETICRKGRPPPSTIKARRAKHLAPLIDDFIAFAKEHYELHKDRRGPVRSALGYIVRQEEPLRAVLRDGRLRLTNNWSERELRKVVRIRDAALFAGSDLHAESAGAILSLIASAKLHGLDPQQYLRDLIRVLPMWPEERYLELAPLFWAQTRARLDPAELEAEIGWITVPKPVPLRRPGQQDAA